MLKTLAQLVLPLGTLVMVGQVLLVDHQDILLRVYSAGPSPKEHDNATGTLDFCIKGYAIVIAKAQVVGQYHLMLS